MDAVILAGGMEEPGSPLFHVTGPTNKCLTPLCGKPMVQWVVEAVDQAPSIAHLHVLGLDESSGLSSSKPLAFYPDEGSMLSNILAGIEIVHQERPEATHLLLASGDIPALTPDIVEWRIQAGLAHNVDIDYAVVEEDVMEARFPGANRSYLKLKDAKVCGGDLNIVHVSSVTRDRATLERIFAARKSALKQAGLIGWDLLILLLLRQLTLDGAVAKVTSNLNISGYATRSPFAEVAMDVDKPHQLDILKQDLARKRQTHDAVDS